MAWIGVTDHHSGWFSLEGAGGDPNASALAPDTLVPRGTLLIEARISSEDHPRTLLDLRRSHPWPYSFTLQAMPGGGIVMVETQGDEIRSIVLPCPHEDSTDIARLTYSWDAPQRTGRLTIERFGLHSIQTSDLPNPHPMMLSDLRDLIERKDGLKIGPDVIFAAVSDQIEPVGPMPGLTSETPILTTMGERPVHTIRRGDVVITDQGELVPVLQVVRRVVPARGSFRPVRLRAGYFDLVKDIVVAPHQQLVMRSSQVEYMFGREAVLVPARHLINNMSALPAKGPEMVSYHQLLLPGHEAVVASGCAVESLYIGRIRRKRDQLAASILAPFDRSSLPEHAKPAWQVLKPFEAITLATSRVA